MRQQQLHDVRNADGRLLSVRIDVPDGVPRGTALFAHCFTCSKTSIAAARTSAALVKRGFRVARFDFTGLGESEGELSETDFSLNVEDLLTVADALRAHGNAPDVLIGHSLGGAAVLVAAPGISELKAVATINAPCHPSHVRRLFDDDELAAIESAGEGRVNLGGRPFTVSARFLEDIDEQRMDEALRELRRPLLIFHAPQDMTVAIDAARHLFELARHPKSFISLDGADHLLTGPGDAAYVAEVLASWASRYLPSEPEVPLRPLEEHDAADVVVREAGEGRFLQTIRAGRHTWSADEPASVGGDDEGPSPYQLLLASLGACTTMTLRMYAERKGWPLSQASVRLVHEKIAADASPLASPGQRKVDHIVRQVTLEGALDDEQRSRLLEIADRCPVHRTLHEPVWIETALKGSDEREE